MRHFRLLIITTLITLSTSLSAFAGSWEEDAKGWWYKNNDGSYPRGTWFTFATTGKQYYFDNDGYLLVNTTTPDGYKVGPDGAYLDSDPSNIAKANAANNKKSGSYVNSGHGVVGNNSAPKQNSNSLANNSNSNNNSNNNGNNTNSNNNGNNTNSNNNNTNNTNSNNNNTNNSNNNPNTATAANKNTGSSGSAMISSNGPEPDTTTVLKSPS